MQNSYWVNYYRLVFMTRFAATVRAGPAQQSLATVIKGKTIVRHAKDASSLKGVLATSVIQQAIDVGRKPMRRKYHLYCEEAIRLGVLAPS